MIGLYKCLLVEKGWMTDSILKKDFILAVDLKDAKETICTKWNLRKNAKGLIVEEIPVIRGRITQKTTQDWVTEEEYSYMTGKYTTTSLQRVTHYYCTQCNGELDNKSYKICPHCGALLS